MRKVLPFLILTVLMTGVVFAQEDVKKNWVSGEISLLGVGVRYEFMLNPKFSVGVNGYWNNLFIVWNDWGVGANGRFYPWGGSFFAELGLGFSFHSGIDDYNVTVNDNTYIGSDWVGTTGVGIAPGVGWKIDAGKPGGFFVQPGIRVPVTLGRKKPIIDIYRYDGKFGAGVGVIIYCGFGGAF